MFIRRKPSHDNSGHDYYQVIETYREGGKVKHRSIVSLGTSSTPAEAIKHQRANLREWRRQLFFVEEQVRSDQANGISVLKRVQRNHDRLVRWIAEGEAKVEKLKAVSKALEQRGSA